MDEKTLTHHVKALKKGNLSHFDAVYEATRVQVYYTALLVLKDESLAEDIMQETYLKMLESLPSYRPKQKFVAWLTTIARNLSINAYNRRKRELYLEDEKVEGLFGGQQDASENTYYLAQLLAVLSDDEKHVIIEHVVLGKKHKDIATTLQKPLGTITWMYQNALKKLRRKAGEDDA